MTSNDIPVSECRRLLDGGMKLDLLDVRTRAEFSRVHALGAMLIPLDELDPAAIAVQRRDATAPLYILCQSGGRAANACQRLRDAGLANVVRIAGGTDAWEKAGLPVERGGGKVISLERQVRIAAGAIVLLGSIFAWRIHPAFLAIPAFVGAGLVFAGVTDFCGMGMLLAKMPWNRRGADEGAKCSAQQS